MTGPRPQVRARSPWVAQDDLSIDGLISQVWSRRVHDGALTAIRSREPGGWHLSISHRYAGRRAGGRYPNWDEITQARYELLPDELLFVMHLPSRNRYVSFHDTTFHLYEHHDDLG